jgi:peptidoglycan hydrolase CwlO-like protein
LDQNNPQELWSKVFVLERDLLENQKSLNRMDSSYNEVLNKLEKLKEEIRSKKSVDDFEDRLKDLEEMVDSLRQEMPEMRLIRKIVFALVAFILTAFLGVLWNTVIINQQKSNTMRIENSQEVVKKILEEYNNKGLK